MAYLKHKAINDLHEFLHQISDVSGDDLLFRGQSCDRDLIPKLGRSNLSLKIPIADAEIKMLESFKKRSIPFLKQPPANNWDWLAVAQHHGLPTRLLDWTTNPLAALWFAVQDPCASGEEGVVWGFLAEEADMVTSKDSDPFKIQWTKVFQPNHLADRIRAQQGWFTAHLLMDHGFSIFNQNPKYKERLLKFSIAPKHFSNIRHDLDRCGINHATIYADLDGVCSHIGWVNSPLSDEY